MTGLSPPSPAEASPSAGLDVSGRLLDHLRTELGQPSLDYAEPLSPISGGYDTRIFAFRLGQASGPFNRPPILRLLGPRHDPTRALRERTVQNVVAGLGFPAPRVLSASADPSLLGGAFLVMERLPGRPMLDERRIGMGSALVETQCALHRLDAGALLEAMGPASRDLITFEGFLTQLATRVARQPLPGLRRAIDWLLDRRPAPGGPLVICHGDFHPLNVLMADGAVTGVIDWPNTVVADPAYDVAQTRTILSCTPVELFPVPAALRWVAQAALALLATRYLSGYRRCRPVDPASLAYYEAASCMRGLVRVAAARLAAASGAALSPLDASSFGERLSARFAEISGLQPTLPAVSGRQAVP